MPALPTRATLMPCSRASAAQRPRDPPPRRRLRRGHPRASFCSVFARDKNSSDSQRCTCRSFEIRSGEILGLIARTAAGKTPFQPRPRRAAPAAAGRSASAREDLRAPAASSRGAHRAPSRTLPVGACRAGRAIGALSRRERTFRDARLVARERRFCTTRCPGRARGLAALRGGLRPALGHQR